TIYYQVSSQPEQSISWTGSLTQNQSTVVQLPAITVAGGNNSLTVRVAGPNGSNDENSSNNEISISFGAIIGESALVTLSLTFDLFPGQTSWTIRDENNVIITSSNGNSYGNEQPGSTISEEF